MTKRLLGAKASEIREMNSKELLKAITLSEGRIIAAESLASVQPVLYDITNAEVEASMGADMLIINLFDVNQPSIKGLDKCASEDTIRRLKQLTGRIVGINLEPVEGDAGSVEEFKMSQGRVASVENAKKAKEMGVDFIILTGNPGTGVNNDSLVKSLKRIRASLGDETILMCGKMHGSGILEETGENIITKDDIKEFIDAGADVILIPAPGTIPGISQQYISELIRYIHSQNKLAMTCIGTSQEGSDVETIRSIALMSKMAGADIHHIGDSGFGGMAMPENIMAYSIAIRGIRHTYHLMGQSINR